MALGSFFYDNMMASWVVDTRTLRFIEVNAKCLTTYGYSKAEFLDRLTVTDLFPSSEKSNIIHYLEQTDNSPAPTLLPQVKKNGTTFQAIIYVKPVEFYGRHCAFITAIDNNEVLLSRSLPDYVTAKSLGGR
jgi:PAS domain S-box-containing protein